MRTVIEDEIPYYADSIGSSGYRDWAEYLDCVAEVCYRVRVEAFDEVLKWIEDNIKSLNDIPAESAFVAVYLLSHNIEEWKEGKPSTKQSEAVMCVEHCSEYIRSALYEAGFCKKYKLYDPAGKPCPLYKGREVIE